MYNAYFVYSSTNTERLRIGDVIQETHDVTLELRCSHNIAQSNANVDFMKLKQYRTLP